MTENLTLAAACSSNNYTAEKASSLISLVIRSAVDADNTPPLRFGAYLWQIKFLLFFFVNMAEMGGGG